MKVKLSVLAILVGCLFLLITCSDQQKKANKAIDMPLVIQKALKEKYPKATVLDFEKENNGSEVDIQERGTRKEVFFDTNGKWLYTKWDIHPEKVPVVIMDELVSSIYKQYKVKEVNVIEKPTGTFYVFDLKHHNNEVKITFNSMGQVLEERAAGNRHD